MPENKKPREFWIIPEEQCNETGHWLGCSVELTEPKEEYLPRVHVIRYSEYEKLEAENNELKKELKELEDDNESLHYFSGIAEENIFRIDRLVEKLASKNTDQKIALASLENYLSKTIMGHLTSTDVLAMTRSQLEEVLMDNIATSRLAYGLVRGINGQSE